MTSPLRIVYLTAGAAGMYCGSCMHDNAIAKALRAVGDDVLLQPVYTPIRTDEPDIATSQIFLGGLNVYLLQKAPWLARLPRWTRSWLDRPGLIRWATKGAGSTDAAELGELTLSMLRGEHGRQAEEIRRLVDWLTDDIRPDAVVFTNLLIGGAIPTLRQRLPGVRVIVMLQGDDIFLDHLPPTIRQQAIELCGPIISRVDRFVTHSDFYRRKMGQMLGIPIEQIDVHPLSIDLTPFEATRVAGRPELPPLSKRDGEFRIGYFARIAPEKGLHLLAEAFEQVASKPGAEQVTLHAGGYLGDHHRGYLQQIRNGLAAAGLADRFHYHGSPELAEKIRLLRSFDVLSVPTPYEEPKGLYVLEAWASGVPVIQPNHGAFPELIRDGQGGFLFPPGDVEALGQLLESLHATADRLSSTMSGVGQQLLETHHTIASAQLIRSLCQAPAPLLMADQP